MLIASNVDLVPLFPDKAGQQMASLDSHFLPTPTLALLQGKSDPTCLFYQFWSSFGKLISMDNFPSHLQKEPCGGLPAHVQVCHEDGAVGPGESRGPAPACSPAKLRGSNPPPCLMFSCLHVCFCACQEPQTTRQTACVGRDHLV